MLSKGNFLLSKGVHLWKRVEPRLACFLSVQQSHLKPTSHAAKDCRTRSISNE